MMAPMQPGIDWAAVQAAASWRLVVPRTPMRGRVGERLGAGTGSSLEFQDHRSYVPGDDLRHVDWKAYARSSVLSVRLYREEIAPRIDLVIDRSRSMTATASKHRAYGELVALLASAATSMSADTRLVTNAAAPPIPLHRAADVERFLECDAVNGAVEEPRLVLRRQSMRVVISDFLFPHDPDSVVGRLARDGASLAIVQLTTREEAEPEVEGGRRLVDVEGHGELDVTIDARTVTEYRARFNRLRQGLSRAARRAGATFVHVIAGAPPRQVARVLADAGILEPR
jgi:uncharacterized protein (DUF58 family)